MFPAYIASRYVGNEKLVLWQLDHYHYELEIAATGKSVDINMPDTSFEEAKARFDNYGA